MTWMFLMAHAVLGACGWAGSAEGVMGDEGIAFEDRLSFQFDADGLLTVAIAGAQHVLMPDEADELRCWLFTQGMICPDWTGQETVQ